MKLFNIFTSLIFFISTNNSIESLKIDKVIIWGHPLHSHTHSYIHYGFYKAFKHLGYKTYWLNNKDIISTFDFSNSLFITESQVDEKIPLREDCYYILHNCTSTKYSALFKKNRIINIQVYTHDCLTRNLEVVDKYILLDRPGKLVYMPWATDLLPEEIEANKKKVGSKKTSTIYWVGTIGSGEFGNIEKIQPFITACTENKISFKHSIYISPEENIKNIQESFMAPTIVGAWQERQGYIPCRIFKNISYGQMGITNSYTVYDIFDKKIVYNSDTYQLFFDAKKRLENVRPEDIYELMDVVKNKHTYLNRVKLLLKFFDEVTQN